MTEFSETIWRERRLLMLQLLNSQTEGSAGDRAITIALREMDHNVTRDQVQAHLAWLTEQLLVSLITLADGSLTATITQRGADIAAGRSSIPGVLRGGRI